MVEKLTKSERKSRRKRRFLRTLVVTVGLLIMIRIALPFVILRTINKELEVLPTYTCVVQDISMSLIDQSITLKGIKMTKKNGKIDVPFFVSGDINVFLESYEKRTVKVIVETCILNLVKGKTKELSQLTIDDELKEMLKEIPLKPNTFILHHAEVHFIEKYRSPNIDLSVKNITIDGRNIENSDGSAAKFPAILTINGEFEGGKLKAVAKLNKQEKQPRVNLVSSLRPFQIKNARNFLKVYADLDVDSGTLAATSIINIYEGRMDGFIDPVAKNLVFHKDYDKEKPKLGKRIKQSLLDGVSKLLGREEEKIETRIELHGTMGEVKIDVWKVVSEGLKNSFIVGAPKED